MSNGSNNAFAIGAATAPPPAPLAVSADDLARVSDRRSSGNASPAGLFFCGGFHSSMEGNKAQHCQVLAAARDLDCHRFDYRGHGASAGDCATLGLEHWLADTLAALDAVTGPQLLVGSSMGAWIAVLAAQRRPERVAGLLTLAAAPDFTERLMRPGMPDTVQQALAAGQSVTRSSGYDEQPWPIPAVLLESGKRLSVLQAPTPLGMPLSLLHGTADTDVPDSLSRELLEAVGGRDDVLTLLHGADHRLSDDVSLRAVERALDELLARLTRVVGVVRR